MWPMHQQSLILLQSIIKEKMHLYENKLFTGNVAKCLYNMWPMHLKTFKSLRWKVKEMHLQENTFFDLDIGVKV